MCYYKEIYNHSSLCYTNYITVLVGWFLANKSWLELDSATSLGGYVGMVVYYTVYMLNLSVVFVNRNLS